jgi:phosphohistidine phosphatase
VLPWIYPFISCGRVRVDFTWKIYRDIINVQKLKEEGYMQIILFRHGVAEDRRVRRDDGSRELTDEGRRKVLRSAGVLSRILAKEKLIIWHSPLVRTEQTAEILRTTLGLDGKTPKDWIATGSAEKLKTEIRDTDIKTLVIVGHAPILDYWCEDLCGEMIRLKKGAAVCMSGQIDSAMELVWLMQPKGWKVFSNIL